MKPAPRCCRRRKAAEIMAVDLDGPRDGEVLVETSDRYRHRRVHFVGADPEGIFPAILPRGRFGVVVDVGNGVTRSRRTTTSSPYTPECRQRPSCRRARPTCAPPSAPRRQGRCRRASIGDKIFTRAARPSNFTVLPEIAWAKVDPDAPFDKISHRLGRHHRHRCGHQHGQVELERRRSSSASAASPTIQGCALPAPT